MLAECNITTGSMMHMATRLRGGMDNRGRGRGIADNMDGQARNVRPRLVGSFAEAVNNPESTSANAGPPSALTSCQRVMLNYEYSWADRTGQNWWDCERGCAWYLVPTRQPGSGGVVEVACHMGNQVLTTSIRCLHFTCAACEVEFRWRWGLRFGIIVVEQFQDSELLLLSSFQNLNCCRSFEGWVIF